MLESDELTNAHKPSQMRWTRRGSTENDEPVNSSQSHETIQLLALIVVQNETSEYSPDSTIVTLVTMHSQHQHAGVGVNILQNQLGSYLGDADRPAMLSLVSVFDHALRLERV